MKEKGMKVNDCKAKAFCTGAGEVYSHSAKFPCSVCGKEVETNSMKCTKCTKWVHKKCFGLQDSA